MIKFFCIVSFSFSYLLIQAQVGFYKTAEDYENNNLTEFDEVKSITGALGCKVTFFKNGKKVHTYNQNDIFGYKQGTQTYRFFKYTVVEVFTKGAISHYGLVPAQQKYYENEKAFYQYSKLQFISKGLSGELITLKNKSLIAALNDDAELQKEYGKRQFYKSSFIIRYNLRHPIEDGYVMDDEKKLSYDEVRDMMNIKE